MKKIAFLTLILQFSIITIYSQTSYNLPAPKQPMEIREGGLKMGGTAPNGGSIAVNNFFVSRNGRPVIPIMGEFHYVRTPETEWEDEILKMKAGGITCIPTYVFWNTHEEREGEWNWAGNRNLRRFVELCGKHGMDVIVRIGPFDHGEIRNGGFPDWLFTKPIDVRSNDERYLHYVRILYHQIAQQLRELYYKDGGPIIGIQIENEHQHSAAPWAITYKGEPKDHTSATYDAGITMVGVSVQDQKITYSQLGDLHMKTLKQMAEAEGIVAPLYTATGWGMAAVIGNEAIPVTSAYTYPFWAKPHKSQFCKFKDLHKEPDYSPVRYNPEDFPSFSAELGVGIQMIYESRPVITAEAAEALAVRCLGSGANGIGYYMYHGGATPKQLGGVGFLSDEPMGVPKISYDFQAPVGQYGLEGRSYRNLRLVHHFINDYQDILAPMETVLPEGCEQIKPDDRETLRHCARMKDGSGFLFMINFQDHDEGRHAQDVNIQVADIQFPKFKLGKDESAILPFRMPIADAVLRYATAQPLMKLGEQHYIFYAPEGITPEFCFEKGTVRGKNLFRPVAGERSSFVVKTKSGKQIRITTLTRRQALDATKVGNRLFITSALALSVGGEVRLQQLASPNFVYTLVDEKGRFTSKTASVEGVIPEFKVEKIGSRRMMVNFRQSLPPQVREFFLSVKYTGDVGMAFLNNELVDDHFYYGEPWMIGLNRYAKGLQQDDLSFYFRPLRKDAPFLTQLPQDAVPEIKGKSVLNIDKVEVVPEYQVIIKL